MHRIHAVAAALQQSAKGLSHLRHPAAWRKHLCHPADKTRHHRNGQRGERHSRRNATPHHPPPDHTEIQHRRRTGEPECSHRYSHRMFGIQKKFHLRGRDKRMPASFRLYLRYRISRKLCVPIKRLLSTKPATPLIRPLQVYCHMMYSLPSFSSGSRSVYCAIISI